MKKLLCMILSIVLILSVFTSCELLPTADADTNNGTSADGNTDNAESKDKCPGCNAEGDEHGRCEHCNGYLCVGTHTDCADGTGTSHSYTAFTPAERAMLTEAVGHIIPFIPNDEYYLEDLSDYGMDGLNYYTIGNTEEEFNAYLRMFSSYTFVETYADDYGDTCYVYMKDGCYVDLCYYVDDGESYVDVYLYTDDEEGDGTLYTDFTSSEKQMFLKMFGEVIPFLASEEYYVEDLAEYDMSGLNYYTIGNTEEEFISYLEMYSAYTFVETYTDEYGDTCYLYQKDGYYVDICYYVYDGESYVDVYIYTEYEGGSGSGSGGSGSTGDTELLTNDGKGLPEGSDGVYDIDFSEAEYVKNVTDQGYYLDGCPTTGQPGVLVIPVDFIDQTAVSKGYEISAIENAFLKNGTNDYYSVYDYYYISSYGQLNLDITVLDYWFRPENSSTYYENATMMQDGVKVEIGDQLILDEALAYLETVMDLSKYDWDNNGIIDAVVLVNTLDIGDDDFHWAYRYWNTYTDDDGYYYEYDGVSANDYIWVSYQFLHEEYDEAGNVSYDNTDVMNTYTFIHEFGHVLGLDDYYDYAGTNEPMLGCDVMDAMAGDQNAYSKINLGWIPIARLVTTDTSVTLSLGALIDTVDVIILANNWNPALGAYQEYYIISYYKSTSLNGGDYGYFERDGIVVYHVNASLFKEVYDGETYYDVYNMNTSGSDGTVDNLIEYVESSSGTLTYVAGDTLPSVTDDSGNLLGYTFTVDELTDNTATITFTKVK